MVYESAGESVTASFKTRRVNKTTFLVVEDDLYQEHPHIYVKIHPRAPVVVISDTGCDEPSGDSKKAKFTHLRRFLEHCPVEAAGGVPLNPGGERQYIVICTHCHYDHVGGVMQFVAGGTTDIIASGAGRDFIESNLGRHGLFEDLGRPTPYYHVTLWARSFERLKYPLRTLSFPHRKPGNLDLGISIIQTPGHTPDELAWYDHDEKHLYVGDSFYEEGEDGMPVIWPSQGNLIEWAFSMQKLQYFVRSENAKAAEAVRCSEEDWVDVPSRVKVGCGHQTMAADGEEIFAEVERLWWAVVRGKVPVTRSEVIQGELNHTWREKGKKARMSFQAPVRLMVEARDFFGYNDSS